MTDWRLQAHPDFPGVAGPVVIVVMDGVGCGAHDKGDAVWLAKTPTLDRLARLPLFTQLRAHGLAVGLPSDADMGNSEVGHNTLGAGRVFEQGAKRVADALATGEVFEGAEWKRLTARVKQSGEAFHFIGLLSDGNVHSHIDHLFAMLAQCHREGLHKVRVHVLIDGRDVPKTSALEYVGALEQQLDRYRAEGRDYAIASGGGRMQITMDRYGADWAMVERGWRLHVRGEGRGFASATEAIETLRREDPQVIDQDLPGFVIVDGEGRALGPIHDGAAVVFFNFRGDRALELTRAFTEEAFSKFDRGEAPDVAYAGMMQYDGDLQLPKHYLVQPPAIDRTMGEYLVHNDVHQFACSETQKFGHVTYFWNGNRSGYIDKSRERYQEVPSDLVPFNEKPEMKAAQITDALIQALQEGRFRHARINYANGDMVGHTGDLAAAIVAMEAVDRALARILPVIDKLQGALIVTADHGNCDDMLERDKQGAFVLGADGMPVSKTSHSLNRVPCMIHAPSAHGLELSNVARPGLANVPATALQLLGYARPDGYEPSLLK